MLEITELLCTDFYMQNKLNNPGYIIHPISAISTLPGVGIEQYSPALKNHFWGFRAIITHEGQVIKYTKYPVIWEVRFSTEFENSEVQEFSFTLNGHETKSRNHSKIAQTNPWTPEMHRLAGEIVAEVQRVVDAEIERLKINKDNLFKGVSVSEFQLATP